MTPDHMSPRPRFPGAVAGSLARALDTEDPRQLARSAQQAYALAFGITAALGAVLGALALWWRPLELPAAAAPALVATAVALAALTFGLSGHQLRRGLAQVSGARQQRSLLLAAAFGLSAAPAVPWLLACAALPQLWLALALAALAALVYGLGRWQIGQWARHI